MGLLQALSLLPQGCGEAAPGEADIKAQSSQPRCFPYHRNFVLVKEKGSLGLGLRLVSAYAPVPACVGPKSPRVFPKVAQLRNGHSYAPQREVVAHGPLTIERKAVQTLAALKVGWV